MNGYSKIKIIGTASKSGSMDFSDLLSSSSSSSSPFPQIPRKSISKNTTQNPETKIQQTNHKQPTKPINTPQDQYSFTQKESEDHHHPHQESSLDANRFGGAKLSRTTSVSSASVALQSAVKRAFSMKRSTSVSERYRRIHDQSVTLASPIDDNEDGAGTEATRSVKKKHSKSKIFKACKRLIGL